MSTSNRLRIFISDRDWRIWFGLVVTFIWIGGGLMSAWRAAKYGECVLAFWPDEDSTRDVWLPKLAEEGAKYGTDPKLATFSFVYVADSDADYAAYEPKLKTAVGFEQPEVDPHGKPIPREE